MDQYRKAGVFLKNSPIDEALLAFAAHIAGLGVRELHFFHIDDPENLQSFGALSVGELEAIVAKAMPKSLTAGITCEVRKGDYLENTLRIARDEDLDLLTIGRKLPSSQVGLGSRVVRIARKSPCNVLVVPELCTPHFGRIMVAVDCSDYSKRAVEAAVALAKTSGERHSQLVAVTVRQLPSRPDLAGVTFKESLEVQRQRGHHDLDRFLSSIDAQGISIEPLVVLSERPALAITHAATAKKMDVVVAGSRGTTSTTATLLGSTSEELLMACAMPILLTKKKGETLSFLAALFATG
jgi:nucleotide-binding universal stress UspA family protein